MNAQTAQAPALIHEHFSEVLTDIRIDNMEFRVTWSPLEMNACILWFRDTHVTRPFEALGKFTCFDKRTVLDFVARYATSEHLRTEIEKRRFERRVAGMSPTSLESLHGLDAKAKTLAFRNLFNLDAVIDPEELAWKRRLMARRFHPDSGGTDESMSVINEAYEHLSRLYSRRH